MTFGEEVLADFKRRMNASNGGKQYFHKRASDMLKADAIEAQIAAANDGDGELRKLYQERDDFNRKHPRGMFNASSDDRKAWVKANPHRALLTPQAHVNAEIVAAERARGVDLAKRIAQVEIERAQGPAVDAVIRKSAQYAAHAATPEARAARTELARLEKRESELLAENPRGDDLTNAQRRERQQLAINKTRAWIAANEPRFRPDREIIT